VHLSDWKHIFTALPPIVSLSMQSKQSRTVSRPAPDDPAAFTCVLSPMQLSTDSQPPGLKNLGIGLLQMYHTAVTLAARAQINRDVLAFAASVSPLPSARLNCVGTCTPPAVFPWCRRVATAVCRPSLRVHSAHLKVVNGIYRAIDEHPLYRRRVGPSIFTLGQFSVGTAASAVTIWLILQHSLHTRRRVNVVYYMAPWVSGQTHPPSHGWGPVDAQHPAFVPAPCPAGVAFSSPVVECLDRPSLDGSATVTATPAMSSHCPPAADVQMTPSTAAGSTSAAETSETPAASTTPQCTDGSSLCDPEARAGAADMMRGTTDGQAATEAALGSSSAPPAVTSASLTSAGKHAS
jgi:hypothetical protein